MEVNNRIITIELGEEIDLNELSDYGISLTKEQKEELERNLILDLNKSSNKVTLDTLNENKITLDDISGNKKKEIKEEDSDELEEDNLVVGDAIADLIGQGYIIKESILRRQYSSVMVKIQEGLPNQVIKLSGLPIKVLNKIAKEMTPFSTAMDSRVYQELKIQEKGEELFMQFIIEDETYPHPFILKLKLIQNNFQEEDISW